MGALDEYKSFIDDMVELSTGSLDEWVRSGKFPDIKENREINQVLAELSEQQRAVVAQIVQQSRGGGIHDVLAYFNERADLEGMKIISHGIELPSSPFGTEMHYDYVCRREGDDWPDPEANA